MLGRVCVRGRKPESARARDRVRERRGVTASQEQTERQTETDKVGVGENRPWFLGSGTLHLFPRGPRAPCTPRASSDAGLLPFQTLPPTSAPCLLTLESSWPVELCFIKYHQVPESPSLRLHS